MVGACLWDSDPREQEGGSKENEEEEETVLEVAAIGKRLDAPGSLRGTLSTSHPKSSVASRGGLLSPR